MMQPLFTKIALSSFVIVAGILEISVNPPTAAFKLNSQIPTAGKNPIYISQSTTTPASIEQAVYTQINEYRANRGLPPLTLDAGISDRARNHSQNMANGTVPFGHDGFSDRVQAIATVIPYRAAAENVAYNGGYADPATKAVQGWLNSPGHLRNIQGNYNLTGIGVAKSTKGAYYFTQIFIRGR